MQSNEVNGPEAAKRFEWALRALCQSASTQLELFPEFAEIGDELALEHEETQELFLASSAGKGLTDAQRQALAALDRRLEQMSGEENEYLWTVEALTTSSTWAEVRRLSSVALQALGWPVECPPRERGAIYVQDGRE